MTTVEVDSQNNNLKLCECGQCNELICIKDSRGRPRRFKKGHHNKGKIRPEIQGENNPSWKGGEKIDRGYVYTRCEGHPKAVKKGHYVRRCRLIMEQHLGRYLTNKEVIHHINRNTTDDRIENLMLFSSHGEHKTFENMKDMTTRICLLCNSSKTRIRKTSGRPVWYKYKDGYICQKCYKKIG